MNEPIRIGIVGAGRIVRAEHLPRFRAIEGVEIVALANSSPGSSQRAAADLRIERTFDDWRALVRDAGVDAVLVGAWPYLHAPVAIAALAAGKHVLTEARMAANVIAVSCVGVFLLVLYLTRFVSLSSILAALALPIFVLWIWNEHEVMYRVFALLVAALVLFTHQKNIGRILRGVEGRVPILKHRDRRKSKRRSD